MLPSENKILSADEFSQLLISDIVGTEPVTEPVVEEIPARKFVPNSGETEQEYEDYIFNRKAQQSDSIKIDESVPTVRRIAYGAAQENTILGNLWELAWAKYEQQDGETYKKARVRREENRQLEIFKEFDEFEGREEDGYVLTGRIGTAVVDPVAWLFPWARVAQAGKIATIGTSAAFAGADIALRDTVLTGDIDWDHVKDAAMFGGIVGGTAETALAFFRHRKSLKNPQDKSGNINNQLELALEIDGQVVLNNLPIIERMKNSASKLSSLYNLQTEIKNKISKLRKKLKKEGSPEQQSLALKYKNQGKNIDGKPIERVNPETVNPELDKLKKELEKINNKIKQEEVVFTPKDRGIIGAESFFEALKPLYKRDSRGRKILDGKGNPTILGKGILQDATWNETGKAAFRALLHETVRPLAYGVGGGLAGITLLDPSVWKTDNSLMYKLFYTGIAMGVMQKRIINYKGPELTTTMRSRALKMIDEEVELQTREVYRYSIGKFFAGTHSTKLSQSNKVIQSFNLALHRNFGIRLGADQVIPESAEEMKDVAFAAFKYNLDQVFGNADEATRLTVGRIIQNRNMKPDAEFNFLKDGDLDNLEALKIADNYIVLQNNFKRYLKDSGLKFENDITYGLTQLFNNKVDLAKAENILTQAFKIQYRNNKNNSNKNFGTRNLEDVKELEKWARKEAQNYLKGASDFTRTEILSLKKLQDENSIDIFTKVNKNIEGSRNLTKSSRFIENERVLYDQEARAFSSDLFIQDPILTTLALYNNVIPYAEFAHRFGARGEGIIRYRNKLRKYYSDNEIKKGTTLSSATNARVNDKFKEDLKAINDSVNNYFGTYQSSTSMNDGVRTFLMAFQTAVATTSLEKVALPSLGDAIQTIQNSSSGSAWKSLLRQMREGIRNPKAKKPSVYLGQIRKWQGRQYGSTGTLDHLLSDTTMPQLSKGATQRQIQEYLYKFQSKFFEIVQLGRVTRFAREFAYDTGAFEIFNMSRRMSEGGKLTTATKRKLSYLGADKDDLVFLSQFKDMDDAFSTQRGKQLINKAGWRTADRDAMIPQLGNRRLFSQSNNPMVKAAGTFLSWAQAKNTQTSALLSRIEDGEIQLGAKIIAMLPLYYTVRQLAIHSLPESSFKEQKKVDMNFDLDPETQFFKNNNKDLTDMLPILADTAEFSGGSIPWWASVGKNVINPEGMDRTVLETFYPIIGWANKNFKTFRGSVRDEKGPRQTTIESINNNIAFTEHLTKSKYIGVALNNVFGFGLTNSTVLENAKLLDTLEKRDRPFTQEDNTPLTEEESLAFDVPTIDLNRNRQPLSLGGPPVANSDDDPVDRINPYTGETYFSTTKPSLLAILEKRREERKDDDEDMPRMPFKNAGLVVITALKNYFKTKTDNVNPKLIGSDLTPEFLGVDEAFMAAKKQSSKDAFEKTSKNLKLQRKEKHVSTQQKYNEYEQGKITYKDYHSSVMNDVDDAGQKLYAPVMYNSAPLLNDALDIFTFLPRSTKDKTKIIGVNEVIKNNEIVALRLHIPAYQQYNKYIVTVHGGTNITQGVVRGYSNTGYIKKVNFNSSRTGTKKVHDRIENKNTFGRMEGEWQNHSPEELLSMAKQFINDTEWVQVGYNPDKFSYFYNKLTGNPLKSADEVIQIGALVLAKNVEEIPINDIVNKTGVYEKNIDWLKRNLFDKKNNLLFNKGGLVNRLKQRNMYG